MLVINSVVPLQEQFSLKPSHILHYMERVFIKKLVAAIKKEMKSIKEKRYCYNTTVT